MSDFREVYRIPGFGGGLSTRADPSEIAPTASPDCLNVIHDVYGAVQTRQGASILNTFPVASSVCNGLFAPSYNNGNQSMVAFFGDTAYVLSGTTFQTIHSSQGLYSSATRVEGAMYQDLLFVGQGINGYKYNGTNFTRHGIPAPSNTVSAVTGGTAGGNLSGGYRYKIAYVNSYSVAGAVQVTAVATITAANEDIVLTSLPVAPQSFGVNARRIYRTNAGGSTYFLIATISDNTTTSYVDNIASSAAGAAAASNAGEPPTWSLIKAFQERLFMVDLINEPMLVYYTNLGDPFNMAPTNFIAFGDGDGEKIVAISVHGNSLMVYKENSEWAIYMPDTDDTNWVRIKLNAKVGCASHRSIIDFMGMQIFAGQRNSKVTGFFKLTGSPTQPNVTDFPIGSITENNVSDVIEPNVFLIQNSYKGNIAAIEYKNKLWFAVTYGDLQTQNNRVFQFDLRSNEEGIIQSSWVPFVYSGMGFSMFAVYNGALYAGSSLANGYVYLLDDGTYDDNGVAINSYFYTKEFDENQKDQDFEKDFRIAKFVVENTGDWNMGVRIRIDSDQSDGLIRIVPLNPTDAAVYDTARFDIDTWVGGYTRQNVDVKLGTSRGKRIQFGFDNRNTVGNWFKVLNGRFYYNRRGFR